MESFKDIFYNTKKLEPFRKYAKDKPNKSNKFVDINSKNAIGEKVMKEMFFKEIKTILIEFLGEENIKFVRPISIKENVLNLKCSNPIIASQIKLQKTKILEKIKNPQYNIEKIVFSV
ncbi:DUF721 domain-containing protein [Patescibacteria group bacterium]|nr:DUF721 domain-containing protein [Patescibacteria group bacterium]